RAVVFCELALTLKHIDLNAGLAIAGRREDLALLGRNSRVALDQASKDTTKCLNAQGERSHVKQEHILDIASQNASLNGCTDSDHLVRVHTTVRLTIENAADHCLHSRHTRLTTYQHHLINFGGAHLRIRESLHHRATGALNQILNQLLQLGTAQIDHQVLWT